MKELETLNYDGMPGDNIILYTIKKVGPNAFTITVQNQELAIDADCVHEASLELSEAGRRWIRDELETEDEFLKDRGSSDLIERLSYHELPVYHKDSKRWFDALVAVVNDIINCDVENPELVEKIELVTAFMTWDQIRMKARLKRGK